MKGEKLFVMVTYILCRKTDGQKSKESRITPSKWTPTILTSFLISHYI